MFDLLLTSYFQSHRHSKLHFVSPGVNVIVGPTDAGKSAIFRSIAWVVKNRPLGDSFISDFANKHNASVELYFDGKSIHRIKGKTKNEYYLNATKLVAFKQSPPEDIVEALNIDQKLSIQSQIDPFFLLQDSPGERARYLNQIAGLDKISTCISKARSSIDQTKHAISSGEKHKQDLEEQLQGYQWLPKVEGHLAEAEALEGQIEDLSSVRIEIKRIVHAIKTKQAKLEELKKRTKAKKQVEECLGLYEKIEHCKAERGRMQERINEIKDTQSEMKRKRKRLEKDKQKFHDNMPDICPLCGRTG